MFSMAYSVTLCFDIEVTEVIDEVLEPERSPSKALC